MGCSEIRTLAVVTAVALAGGLHGCTAQQHRPSAANPGSERASNTASADDASSSSEAWRERVRAAGKAWEAQFTEPAGRNAIPDPDRSEPEPRPRDRASVYANGGMSLWTRLPASNETTNSINVEQISSTREGADFDISPDPTGDRIAFASTRHRETADLYIKSISSSTVTQLTADPANDVMPAIGPEGERIAFASDRTGNWDLYLLDVAGGQPVQLTRNPAEEVHPSWSPDGEQIAFCSRGPSGRWEIVIIDVDSPSRRTIIGPGLFPVFSPDGKKLAFQKPRKRGARTFSIWTVDLEDGEGRRPTEIAAATNAALIGPTWSPDGRRLAFATVMPAGQTGNPSSADLWAVNIDGTSRVKLTGDEHLNLQPAWGANNRIYFISDRSKWENVWALTPPHSKSKTAMPDSEPAGEPQAAAPAP